MVLKENEKIYLNQLVKEDFQFQHPCNILIAGPTGSGKTVLIRNILKNYKDLFEKLEQKNLIKVLWIYGVDQNLYQIPISENVQVTYVTDLPEIDKINTLNPDLIIFDDLMETMGDSKALSAHFTKYGHHHNRSIIFVIQNLLHQAKQMRTIHLNSHYMILLRNPRAESQVFYIAKQINPKNPQRIMEAYSDAVKRPYGYLCFDYKTNNPMALLKTNLTREENKKRSFMPTLYIEKDSLQILL